MTATTVASRMSRAVWPMLVELVALGAVIAGVWSIEAIATAAWIERVTELGVAAPPASHVHALGHQAALYMTAAVAVLAVARMLGWLRAAAHPVVVPWLIPAAVAASLFGLAIQLSTVEVSDDSALAPTAVAFAQGCLVGSIVAAAILLVPFDLIEAASRVRVAIAVAIAGIFVALGVAGSGPAGTDTRINLGPIQPIELIKPLAVVFLAAYLGARASKLRWQRRRVLGLRWPRVELLVPALGVLVLTIAGLFVIGDLGPVLLLALVFLAMVFVVTRATGWAVVAIAVVAATIAVLALWPSLAGGTVETRLVMWQDPWTNGLGNGHQLGEGLWAISAGGWTGQGLANSATPIVPAGKTDLALATMTEQLGALGLVGYQLAIAVIVIGALEVAARARTAQRTLVATGIAALVFAQWLVILGGTLGYLPLTGIVVPFVSSGRTSLVVFFALVALVARIASDGRERVASTELDELRGAVRTTRTIAIVGTALAMLAGIRAAVTDRIETSARTIAVRLGDGTPIRRQNPRLVAIAERIRRGSILDRNGIALAVSDAPAQRRYPLGAALGTVMGVSPASVALPSWALERQLDERLRGYPSRGPADTPDLRQLAPLLELDRRGRAAAVERIDHDVGARSVRLTLDAKLQAAVAQLAQRAVAQRGYVAAAAVVLDVDSGQVLARVQAPDYDPSRSQWQHHVVARDRRFLDRFYGAYGEWPDKTGLQGVFQSGSIGKLVTALAAVRAGLATSQFACEHSDAQGPLFTQRGWPKPIHDHSRDRPHGSLDLVEALAVSCNVYFGQLGLSLGREPFIALHRAGLDLGFGAELDPGPAGSRQLASTAFGQGAMATNVMQAARMVAAIASGGRYVRCSPTMERDTACRANSIVADPRTLQPIVAGMRRVMTSGTGARLVAPPDVRVYGKTGTAEAPGFAGEQPYGIEQLAEAPPHSWFVAFAERDDAIEAAPARSGRLAVAVVIPRGGSGASAAGPLAMQILSSARELGYLR
ncbi:MAG: FtsW/RodA/SpoVE family cell cycle protein [Kofleriaceae bacterium]